MTNKEKLLADINDRRLAGWIRLSVARCRYCVHQKKTTPMRKCGNYCIGGIMDWLRQEVKEYSQPRFGGTGENYEEEGFF